MVRERLNSIHPSNVKQKRVLRGDMSMLWRKGAGDRRRCLLGPIRTRDARNTS